MGAEITRPPGAPPARSPQRRPSLTTQLQGLKPLVSKIQRPGAGRIQRPPGSGVRAELVPAGLPMALVTLPLGATRAVPLRRSATPSNPHRTAHCSAASSLTVLTARAGCGPATCPLTSPVIRSRPVALQLVSFSVISVALKPSGSFQEAALPSGQMPGCQSSGHTHPLSRIMGEGGTT